MQNRVTTIKWYGNANKNYLRYYLLVIDKEPLIENNVFFVLIRRAILDRTSLKLHDNTNSVGLIKRGSTHQERSMLTWVDQS